MRTIVARPAASRGGTRSVRAIITRATARRGGAFPVVSVATARAASGFDGAAAARLGEHGFQAGSNTGVIVFLMRGRPARANPARGFLRARAADGAFIIIAGSGAGSGACTAGTVVRVAARAMRGLTATRRDTANAFGGGDTSRTDHRASILDLVGLNGPAGLARVARATR